MPANDGRHDCKPHHARSTTISAAAAMVRTVALAAYTATSATGGNTAPPGSPATASLGASRHTVTLTAAAAGRP